MFDWNTGCKPELGVSLLECKQIGHQTKFSPKLGMNWVSCKVICPLLHQPCDIFIFSSFTSFFYLNNDNKIFSCRSIHPRHCSKYVCNCELLFFFGCFLFVARGVGDEGASARTYIFFVCCKRSKHMKGFS
jgi:hypothetical protein